jgi:hypothetical protein
MYLAHTLYPMYTEGTTVRTRASQITPHHHHPQCTTRFGDPIQSKSQIYMCMLVYFPRLLLREHTCPAIRAYMHILQRVRYTCTFPTYTHLIIIIIIFTTLLHPSIGVPAARLRALPFPPCRQNVKYPSYLQKIHASNMQCNADARTYAGPPVKNLCQRSGAGAAPLVRVWRGADEQMTLRQSKWRSGTLACCSANLSFWLRNLTGAFD